MRIIKKSGGTASTSSILDALSINPAVTAERVSPAIRLRLPRLTSKIREFALTSGGQSSYPWALPIRIMAIGDSLIESSLDVGLQSIYRSAGGGSATGILGAISGSVTSVVNQFSLSPNGTYFELANGAVATFRNGSGGTAGAPGDRLCVAYLAYNGAGSMTIDYSRDNGSTWINATTINCQNATTIGAWYQLDFTYADRVQIRITSTGTTRVLSCGAFTRGMGGVVTYSLFCRGGLNANQYACPQAITTPIIQGFGPDLIPVLWHDNADIYDAGGFMDTIIGNVRAATTVPDVLALVKNPEGPTTHQYMQDVMLPAVQAWANRNGAAFYDSYSIFGDLASATTAGLLIGGSDAHPTTLGYWYRNQCIVRDVFSHAGIPTLRSRLGVCDVRMEHLGGQKGLVIDPEPGQPILPANPQVMRFRGDIMADNALWVRTANETGGWTNRAGFTMNSGECRFVNQTGGGLAPDTTNTLLGWTSRRWNVIASGHSAATNTRTADYTLTDADHTVVANASSPVTFTLPTATSSINTGRIYHIKNLTANALTITGAQTIDGQASVVLSVQNSAIKIQSNGTNWMILERYL